MFRSIVTSTVLGSALTLAASTAGAMSVDIWDNKGNDAVYQPGDKIDVKMRASDDAYLLIYEIDAEGYVHVLFPFANTHPLIEGHKTYSLNQDRPDAQLVVQGPVGQGYIVAVASRDPFAPLPWFLRPADPRAQDLGYADTQAQQTPAVQDETVPPPPTGTAPSDEGFGSGLKEQSPDEKAPATQTAPPAVKANPDEIEGITPDGRIVGDPFVMMERIRRRVLVHPDDAGAFATAYVGYYVHEQVKYPRYLCYDCHRPGYYSWWDGFDPYYTTCSAFSFHVNYSWYWGPPYWYGYVPYYVYTYVPSCPPRYRAPYPGPYSSWDGWARWTRLWDGGLKRIKSPVPAGYIPPSRYANGGGNRGAPIPPGFLASAHGPGRLERGASNPSGGYGVRGMLRDGSGAQWRPIERGTRGADGTAPSGGGMRWLKRSESPRPGDTGGVPWNRLQFGRSGRSREVGPDGNGGTPPQIMQYPRGGSRVEPGRPQRVSYGGPPDQPGSPQRDSYGGPSPPREAWSPGRPSPSFGPQPQRGSDGGGQPQGAMRSPVPYTGFVPGVGVARPAR